ncbi:FAD-linked oxidoreductase-like protein [Cytidiella melzeri]|nr:FAD-linked oxidoreductase-like protein [Cytidiella melzeri]
MVVTTSVIILGTQDRVHADAEELPTDKTPATQPLSSLLRSYIVYAMCSIPFLVDYSPTILSTCLSIPILQSVTEAFVRVTFFEQFVGAETAEDAIPLLERFRSENKGCLFAYSVEVDEDEAAGKGKLKGNDRQPVHKQIVQEMIHSIDVAADFEDKHRVGRSQRGRRTWVAIKLTALVPDHHILTRLSQYLVEHRSSWSSVPFPGTPQPSDLDVLDNHHRLARNTLTAEDITVLRELRADLESICRRASQRNVRVIFDAEHSWYQPAVDAFVISLMSQFNRQTTQGSSSSVQPLVYNTFQAYLRRNTEHLKQSLRAAKKGGYALGVKLVRGAYHPQESQAHSSTLSISPENLPPVWPVKAETDDCYNACAQLLLDAIADDIAHTSTTSSWKNLIGMRSASAQSTESVPKVGVLFGTHNWESSKLILDGLVSRGIAQVEGKTADGEPLLKINDEVTERLTMAQLYGMHDDLTQYLVQRTRTSLPFVIKYVPYGSLREASVLPYLGRRAIENKSVLGEGAAAEERKRAWEGVKAKLFGA